jgi:hypothetical protein
MSSAGAMPPPYDAVVYLDEHIVGPIRLPASHPDQFVRLFEQTYGRLGIRVCSTESAMHSEDLLNQKQEAGETD